MAGGHRIGLAGQAIMCNGELKALKNIGAMNIRLAREFKGAASHITPFVIDRHKHVLSTLIVGPPCSGKTTLLRDLIRQLSAGVAGLSFGGVQVGLVDERSEIAACKEGVPSADVGPRTDVMDGCPKANRNAYAYPLNGATSGGNRRIGAAKKTPWRYAKPCTPV